MAEIWRCFDDPMGHPYTQELTTRGLFWAQPRNFEQRSDDRDDAGTGSSPIFHATPGRGRLATTYDLTCNGPTNTTDLQWNRISISCPPALKPRPCH
ncbi:hypothetical protein AVEN_209975-1 [Araneus ventricosus]|uniref:Uncharacterized protein n=1 Tax=Araneus ventricosus TaxID=182803 RepID=A0A4Y2DBJ6_ARAVE|nr:hypothetical protein AVEN_209975-1 [Araneus ventricosus]